MPASEESEAARKDLNRYLEQANVPLNALAKRLNIAQPTLYRFAKGQTKEAGGAVQAAIDYARNELGAMQTIPPHAPEENRRLQAAWSTLSRHPQVMSAMVTLIEAIAISVSSGPKKRVT